MSRFSLLTLNFIYLLFNHSYPPRYIYSGFKKFSSTYLSASFILPMISNENNFATINHQLLSKPTISKYQIASQIEKTINLNFKDELDNPLIKVRLDKESKWITNLIIHYMHEKWLQTYKKDICQLWNKTFQQTSFMNIRLVTDNWNSGNMTKQLLHQRPQP